MKLSIIIPTYNEEKNISRLLTSIVTNHAFDPSFVEIIVVDSPRTTDKTKDIVASFEGVILDEIGPERSSQRNHGASLAKGEYVYFVDADMEFSDALLSTILHSLSPEHMLVVPERIPGNSLYCRALNIEKQVYDGNDKISAARVFLKSAFDTVGGYNVEMVSGEDWDLDRRLKAQAGLTLKHIDTPIFHHEANIGFVTSIKKKVYYAKTLKNYQVGTQTEVSPLYRYAILFSKPSLIFSDILGFLYLLCLKTAQFGIGFVVYTFNK